jgi:hypothetical protein
MPNIPIRNGMGTNLVSKLAIKAVSVVFLSPSRHMPGKVPRLGHERFLLHLYRVIIHPSIDAKQPETANWQRPKIKYRDT